MRIRADRGGALVSPDGAVRLELPPHALAHDMDVEIIRYAVTGDDVIDAFAYDLQPDGLQLKRPAQFSVALPPGFQPEEVEVSVYDLARAAWVREPDQEVAAGGDRLLARLAHFSLRRLRIRPGLRFPFEPHHGRATFYLESDAGNNFERYLEGRWAAVRRRTGTYRELMRMGRLSRMSLITSGRLRAITAARPTPTVFLDERRTAAMPAGAPEAITGWVRVRRLDARGRPTGQEVVVRVNDYGPGPAPRRAGVIIDLSRSAMEALGLEWGRDFGLAEDNPDLAWIRIDPGSGEDPVLHYLPVAVEAYQPQPRRAPSCRLW
ncbi:MAG: hypothetical protein Q9Q13_01080 [Acidobacteriota bacterium]|nr:hypothetical protein [Acidobacteriota bacterium]